MKCFRDILFIMLVLMWSVQNSLAADVLHLRDGEASARGQVVKISEHGVQFRTTTGQTIARSWDRVRAIDMDSPPSTLDRYLELAEDIWRARSRLQRGDAALAEPLYDRLFPHYQGQTHETALIVAEGLLRCRMARHDTALALVPALEVTRLMRAGISTDRYDTLPRIMDPASQLCIHIPPVWMATANTTAILIAMEQFDTHDDDVVAAMLALYMLSLNESLTYVEDLQLDRDTWRHPGVRLLRDLIGCHSSRQSQREAARDRLLRDLPSMDDWAQAWTHYVLGVSLLDDSDSLERLGAVHLSHVPARFAQHQPYLAGMAVVQLIEQAERGGNMDAAASLQRDLDRRFSFHPVRLSRN
jgi:hypothetical protein